MPECNKCGVVRASAEMRRSTKPGQWLCYEKYPCEQRVKASKKRLKDQLKSTT